MSGRKETAGAVILLTGVAGALAVLELAFGPLLAGGAASLLAIAWGARALHLI